VDEESQVNPLTAYSKANRAAELDVLSLNDEQFFVTVLRFSSIYGLSPRMRFDLAVNSMVLDLFNSGKIIVKGKSNHRPFLHIQDAVDAYEMILNETTDKTSGEIFNVGSDEQNYQISDLAKEIGNSLGIEYELELRDTKDHRSYTASFKKIKKKLGFQPRFTVKDGSNKIYEALRDEQLSYSLKTITLEWYKHLLSNPEKARNLLLRGRIL